MHTNDFFTLIFSGPFFKITENLAVISKHNKGIFENLKLRRGSACEQRLTLPFTIDTSLSCQNMFKKGGTLTAGKT